MWIWLLKICLWGFGGLPTVMRLQFLVVVLRNDLKRYGSHDPMLTLATADSDPKVMSEGCKSWPRQG